MFETLSARLTEALRKITGRGVLRPEDVDAGLREVPWCEAISASDQSLRR